MKTRHNNMGWLGLALACSIIAFTDSVDAKKGGGGGGKPPKPPPEPPPAATYDLILLESGFYSYDITESGLVLGRMYIPDSDDYPALLIPQEDSGSILWYKDDDLDGYNDLLFGLGIPAEGELNSHAYKINDDGVILGTRPRLVPGTTDYYTQFAWFLAPRMIEGQLTWADLDSYGINSLIMPLHAADSGYLEVEPNCMNNYGEVALVFRDIRYDWQRGALLAPNLYEVSSDGAVTIEYPTEDLDGDGFNDSLIDLGMGIRESDGVASPLLPSLINDRGDVAGVVSKGRAGSERPFVLRPIEDESGGLVWYKDDDPKDGVNDLVIYLPLPEEVVEQASSWSGIASISGMNETGTIVGNVSYGAVKMNRAAIWQVDWQSRSVSYTELGLLERKYDTSNAMAVNAAGQVVGRNLRYVKFSTLYQKGWLWDQGEMIPLDDLLPDLADIYSFPSGITDSGIIVGSQQTVPGGYWTAFIAVPVEEP